MDNYNEFIKTEEGKVTWVVMNTYLNGLSIEEAGEKYDWNQEIVGWAKGKNYFPELSWGEFVEIAKKYEIFIEFEKAYLA